MKEKTFLEALHAGDIEDVTQIDLNKVTATVGNGVPIVNIGTDPFKDKTPEQKQAIQNVLNNIYDRLDKTPEAINKSQILLLATYYDNIELVKKILNIEGIDVNIRGDRGANPTNIAQTCTLEHGNNMAQLIIEKGGVMYNIAKKDGITFKMGAVLPDALTQSFKKALEIEKKFELDACEYLYAIKAPSFLLDPQRAAEVNTNPKEFLDFMDRAYEKSKENWLFEFLIGQEKSADKLDNIADTVESLFMAAIDLDPDLKGELNKNYTKYLTEIKTDYEKLKDIDTKIIGVLGAEGIKQIGVDNLVTIGADALNAIGVEGVKAIGVEGVKSLAENLQQMGQLAKQNSRYGQDLTSIMAGSSELNALYASIKPQIEIGQKSLLVQLSTFINESIMPALHKLLPNVFSNPLAERDTHNHAMNETVSIVIDLIDKSKQHQIVNQQQEQQQNSSRVP